MPWIGFEELKRLLVWSSIGIDENVIQWEDERSKDYTRLPRNKTRYYS